MKFFFREMDSWYSQGNLRKMKCKLPHPGIELGLPIPFQTLITFKLCSSKSYLLCIQVNRSTTVLENYLHQYATTLKFNLGGMHLRGNLLPSDTHCSTLCRLGVIEYADCISIQGITLSCIWGWVSSPRALGNVKYPFITITLRSTLVRIGCTC